jgi:hypothetical protein
LNSDGGEKLRRNEWLISAILREINQLEGMGDAECPPAGTLSWGFSLCIRTYFLGKDFSWQRLPTEGVPPLPPAVWNHGVRKKFPQNLWV